MGTSPGTGNSTSSCPKLEPGSSGSHGSLAENAAGAGTQPIDHVRPVAGQTQVGCWMTRLRMSSQKGTTLMAQKGTTWERRRN